MQEFSYRPWNRIKIKRNLIAGLFGLCGAFLYIGIYHDLKPQKTIATVDITGLIHRFVKVEATQAASPSEMRAQVKNFSQQLELILQSISQEKNFIILPKEAVLAGCPDMTSDVETRLKALEHTHEAVQ